MKNFKRYFSRVAAGHGLREVRIKCGVEIHTQLETKQKLFSSNQVFYKESPNNKLGYFDCGLPGTQPILNSEAIYLALKTGVVLNCRIQNKSFFDRKHYFYPDLPLGYQITQYYKPIAKGGKIRLSRKYDGIEKEEKEINIKAVQIEQDTGKLLFRKKENLILIDLNRYDIPLVEVVTEPDFDDFNDVCAFIRKYQKLVKYYGISSGEMENGAIRVDVNLSLNDFSRVEIKNLGSIQEVYDSLNYEYYRQLKLIKEKQDINQETRGWDGEKTFFLRNKENFCDYRYIYDPELPVISLEEGIEEKIKKELPIHPDELVEKLKSEPYNLEEKHLNFFLSSKEKLKFYFEFFDILIKKNTSVLSECNAWFFNHLIRSFRDLNQEINFELITPEHLSELILLVHENKITLSSARFVLKHIISTKKKNHNIIEIIQKNELFVKVKDDFFFDDQLIDLCSEIIKKEKETVDKIMKGNIKALNHLIGCVMKKKKGNANPKELIKIFNDLIFCQKTN